MKQIKLPRVTVAFIGKAEEKLNAEFLAFKKNHPEAITFTMNDFMTEKAKDIAPNLVR